MTADLRAALRDVVAIPVTPFASDGELDPTAYGRIVEHLLGSGINVVTPNGNTGEFYSLRLDELDRALTVCIDAVAKRALVIAGVGHDVGTAAALAQSAAAAGADAVMVHQPVHPYKSVAGWVAYHQAVAEAAPGIGLVAYVRDPNLPPEAFVRLAEACPSLVAVKYAVAHPFRMVEVVDAVGADRVAWIAGLAESWAPFHWMAGARGFTSGLVNVAPQLSVELLRRLREGDIEGAMALWRQLQPFEAIRARRNDANNVSAVKEAMAQLGLCGRSVRPPITELEAHERDEISVILKQWEHPDRP